MNMDASSRNANNKDAMIGKKQIRLSVILIRRF